MNEEEFVRIAEESKRSEAAHVRELERRVNEMTYGIGIPKTDPEVYAGTQLIEKQRRLAAHLEKIGRANFKAQADVNALVSSYMQAVIRLKTLEDGASVPEPDSSGPVFLSDHVTSALVKELESRGYRHAPVAEGTPDVRAGGLLVEDDGRRVRLEDLSDKLIQQEANRRALKISLDPNTDEELNDELVARGYRDTVALCLDDVSDQEIRYEHGKRKLGPAPFGSWWEVSDEVLRTVCENRGHTVYMSDDDDHMPDGEADIPPVEVEPPRVADEFDTEPFSVIHSDSQERWWFPFRPGLDTIPSLTKMVVKYALDSVGGAYRNPGAYRKASELIGVTRTSVGNWARKHGWSRGDVDDSEE